MEADFKPPWLLYPFAWLSMGWKQGSAEKDRYNFETWYLELPESEKTNFKSKFPESPWWPGYYFYIENITKKGFGGIKPLEYIAEVKANILSYFESRYEIAFDLEKKGSLDEAYKIYRDLYDNSHMGGEKMDRVKCFIDNYEI